MASLRTHLQTVRDQLDHRYLDEVVGPGVPTRRTSHFTSGGGWSPRSPTSRVRVWREGMGDGRCHGPDGHSTQTTETTVVAQRPRPQEPQEPQSPQRPQPPQQAPALPPRARAHYRFVLPVSERAQRFFAPLHCAGLSRCSPTSSSHWVRAGIADRWRRWLWAVHAGYRVCLWSRIASRVLWQLAESEYRHEEEIYRLAQCGLAAPVLGAGDHPRAGGCYSFAANQPEFVTLRVKDAIVDRFPRCDGVAAIVDTSTPDMRIHVFLTAYKVVVYLDLAGEALFKRGYRREGLSALLRENLAAGMLALKGWTGQQPLFDPRAAAAPS